MPRRAARGYSSPVNHGKRFGAFVLVFSLSASAGFAAPGPGPGEPFGGDDAGCVPTTSTRLSCAIAVGKAFDRLEASVVKCHSDQAKSRYDEFVLGSTRPFDEEGCEAVAVARFDDTVSRLATGTCLTSPSMTTIETDRDALLAALDAENAGPWCDDTTGEPIDDGGDDAGWVPATAEVLACGGKVTKNLRALSTRLRKCHRTAGDKGFRLADPAFDEEACEDKFLAKFRATANNLASRGCPTCLSAPMQVVLAEALEARLDSTNTTVFPCPDPVLHVTNAVLDRPTLVTLGVQLLISGDENHDATVSVRYRAGGELDWLDGPPLMRVRPEDTRGRTVPEQFAGSIFDLRPATTYDIELHAVDADGPVDETIPLSATTRSIPADPASPNLVAVTNTAGLHAALAAAAAGDVIEIADGTYVGPFVLDAAGTALNPIVVRGASRDGTILDGGGCEACNVLEVYGSFVHVERMTLRNANRALRFQTAAAEGCVARRLHTVDTRLGIGSRDRQQDFYICDNLMEGPLVWPHVYFDDDGIYSNVDGVLVYGDGHVVCHNDMVGFGDAIKTDEEGARALDFYGNEIRSAYDNGIELDFGEGNVRALRNRFTNNFVPLSFQPLHGGPAYAIRNVAVNLTHEQLKFHGIGGGSGPSGVLVWHNTFVAPETALLLVTDATSHWFEFANNVFVGPTAPPGRVVDWLGPIHNGTFDDDGFYPDGSFRFVFRGGPTVNAASFAALQAAGVEEHGRLLGQPIFANGLMPPASWTSTIAPQDVSLHASSNAIDAGRVLAGVNDGFTGAGPDLGALEAGCPLPIYGIRPEGIDESNEPFGCAP